MKTEARRFSLLLLGVVASAVTAAPTYAASCWHDARTGQWLCNGGCEITRYSHGADGRIWADYSCPQPLLSWLVTEPVVHMLALSVIGTIAFVGVLALVGAWQNRSAYSMSTADLRDDTEDIENQIMQTAALASRLDEAAREADTHLSRFRNSRRYRGD